MDGDIIPEEVLESLEVLAAALLAAKELLATGRAYGLTVGLSPKLKAKLKETYGDSATHAILNTQAVDPDAPFDAGRLLS